MRMEHMQIVHQKLIKMYENMKRSRHICLKALLDIDDMCTNVMCSHGDEGYVLNEEAVKKIIDGAIKNA